jgi:hypothetical protein
MFLNSGLQELSRPRRCSIALLMDWLLVAVASGIFLYLSAARAPQISFSCGSASLGSLFRFASVTAVVLYRTSFNNFLVSRRPRELLLQLLLTWPCKNMVAHKSGRRSRHGFGSESGAGLVRERDPTLCGFYVVENGARVAVHFPIRSVAILQREACWQPACASSFYGNHY